MEWTIIVWPHTSPYRWYERSFKNMLDGVLPQHLVLRSLRVVSVIPNTQLFIYSRSFLLHCYTVSSLSHQRMVEKLCSLAPPTAHEPLMTTKWSGQSEGRSGALHQLGFKLVEVEEPDSSIMGMFLLRLTDTTFNSLKFFFYLNLLNSVREERKMVVFLSPKECMVDEDAKFTELAGPELQNLAVMTEGTDKGNIYTRK